MKENLLVKVQFFTIKNYPDDVFNAVGRIIKAAQELEKDFKNLAELYCVNVKNLNTSSLNVLNGKLKKENCFTSEEFDDLAKIIKERNDINHYFFIKDFCDESEPYDKKILTIENKLNRIMNLICEADDAVNNKIDLKNGGGSTPRPTIIG